MEQISKFAIFSGSIDKDALWLETAEGLANARQRMNEIAAKSPGKYVVPECLHFDARVKYSG